MRFWPIQVAARFPSTLAAYGAAVVIFILLRRRMDIVVSLFSFGIMLSMGLFPFAGQVREYAFLVLFLSLALLFWDNIENSKHPKLNGLAIWFVLALSLDLPCLRDHSLSYHRHLRGPLDYHATAMAPCRYRTDNLTDFSQSNTIPRSPSFIGSTPLSRWRAGYSAKRSGASPANLISCHSKNLEVFTWRGWQPRSGEPGSCLGRGVPTFTCLRLVQNPEITDSTSRFGASERL